MRNLGLVSFQAVVRFERVTSPPSPLRIYLSISLRQAHILDIQWSERTPEMKDELSKWSEHLKWFAALLRARVDAKFEDGSIAGEADGPGRKRQRIG
jgi:hypothetical protein